MGILTDQNLSNLIEKLKKDKVTFTKEEYQRVFDCISFKSLERYQKIARTFPGEVSFSIIDKIYINDIKTRRNFLRMCFFIEVFVRSTITNMFDEIDPSMNFIKDSIINERIYFKLDGVLKNKSKALKEYKKSKEDVLGKMTALNAKKVIELMSFYGINYLYLLLDSKYFVGTFLKNNEAAYANLDLIRQIRNASAHNKIIFIEYSIEEIENFTDAILGVVPFIDPKEIIEIKKLALEVKEMYN